MGKFWLFAAVVMVLAGAPLGSAPLLMAGSLILVLAAVSNLWTKYSLARVEYHHSLSSYRAFTGEELIFSTRLTNRKFLPLPWVQVNDEIPKEVRPVQGRTSPAPHPGRVGITSLLSMGWYHQVTRTYTLRCEHRGIFYLGPVRIRSGDLFGMSSTEMRMERDLLLTVYPRVLPLVDSRLPFWEPYGNVRVRRTLFDDVTRPVGSRDYVVGDSLRYVHWKSTARLGRLQTRLFDASTTANFVLFFGVRTMEHPLQGTIPQLLEMGVLTTVALANYALEKGYPVGVYVNQTSRLTSHFLEVQPARHSEQLTRILEVMAQVHPEDSIPLASLILEQSRNLPWGTTIMVVTAIPDAATLNVLGRLRRAGWGVSLVHIGGPAGNVAGGIPTYAVSGAVDWQHVQEVTLH
ncbi:MAG: DUF58 domain-containing protein [Dehalococcoidia bacterium]|nr:DUF58 domain-containing protein [Dehalococcoidia bacterium]